MIPNRLNTICCLSLRGWVYLDGETEVRAFFDRLWKQADGEIEAVPLLCFEDSGSALDSGDDKRVFHDVFPSFLGETLEMTSRMMRWRVSFCWVAVAMTSSCVGTWRSPV